MPANHLVLYRPLLLPPAILLGIRVFSNESALHIRYPKYWSFSFSIRPSNEHLGLISFRMDWLALLAVQGTLKSSPTPQFKSIDSSALSFLYSPTHIHIWILEKPYLWLDGPLLVQAGYRKVRGTRDQIANIHRIIEKAREFQKNIYTCFIDYAKAFDYVDHNKLWKILKEMGMPVSWEICMQVRKQQLELDMELQTGSKSGKVYVKVVYCHPAYLTYMENTSCEMVGWMNQKLESRLPQKYQ